MFVVFIVFQRGVIWKSTRLGRLLTDSARHLKPWRLGFGKASSPMPTNSILKVKRALTVFQRVTSSLLRRNATRQRKTSHRAAPPLHRRSGPVTQGTSTLNLTN